jgi:glycosyl transferase, family 25
MKYLYINLERRSDRNAQFLRTNSFLQEFQRLEAVEGKTISEQVLVDANLIQEPLKEYTPGAIGCALSHKRAWDMCIAEDQPLTVAEDDAVFNRDFQEKSRNLLKTLREDWDIVLWGWNFDSILDVQVIEGLRDCVMHFDSTPLKEAIASFQATQINSVLLRLFGAFGIVCYSISPRGAERLTSLCFPLRNEVVYVRGLNRSLMNFGIDTLMNKCYRQVNSYVCYPPLVWTDNDKSSSDISQSST